MWAGAGLLWVSGDELRKLATLTIFRGGTTVIGEFTSTLILPTNTRDTVNRGTSWAFLYIPLDFTLSMLYILERSATQLIYFTLHSQPYLFYC